MQSLKKHSPIIFKYLEIVLIQLKNHTGGIVWVVINILEMTECT